MINCFVSFWDTLTDNLLFAVIRGCFVSYLTLMLFLVCIEASAPEKFGKTYVCLVLLTICFVIATFDSLRAISKTIDNQFVKFELPEKSAKNSTKIPETTKSNSANFELNGDGIYQIYGSKYHFTIYSYGKKYQVEINEIKD